MQRKPQMFLALKFVDLITVIHWVYTPEATDPVTSAGIELSKSTILNWLLAITLQYIFICIVSN